MNLNTIFRAALVCAAVGSMLAVSAQTPAKKTATGKSAAGKAEITDLIIYNMIMYDTAKAERIGTEWAGTSISNYNEVVENHYLNAQQSRSFRQELSQLFKRRDLLYFDGYDQITYEKAMQRCVVLVSIQEMDSLGNIIGIKTVADSIDMRLWGMITFFEEWKLNKATGMIEKEVLGYYFNWYSEQKDLWIPMFGVARDKASLEKIRKKTG